MPVERNLPGALLISARDRKSTRLNSSHLVISYAVFCLKKKNSFIKMATRNNTSVITSFCFHEIHVVDQDNTTRPSFADNNCPNLATTLINVLDQCRYCN